MMYNMLNVLEEREDATPDCSLEAKVRGKVTADDAGEALPTITNCALAHCFGQMVGMVHKKVQESTRPLTGHGPLTDPASKAGRMGPSGTDLKPDIYMRHIVAAGATVEPPKYWSTVISFGEPKETEELAGYTATFNYLLLNTKLVLQDQYGYWRGHVVAFLLDGTKLRLFVFDRAGVCVSTLFDIAERPHKFMRCIAGLLVLDDARLGYRAANNAESFTVTFDGTEFIIDRKPVVVPQFDRLVSRVPTCWRTNWAIGGRKLACSLPKSNHRSPALGLDYATSRAKSQGHPIAARVVYNGHRERVLLTLEGSGLNC